MAHNPPRPQGLDAAATMRIAEELALQRPGRLQWRRTWEDQPEDYSAFDPEKGTCVGRLYRGNSLTPWQWFGQSFGEQGYAETKQGAADALTEAWKKAKARQNAYQRAKGG